MKIIIRLMKLIDVGQMMELNKKCLPENYPRNYWIDTYQKGKTHSFVAVFANLVIGYVFCDENTIISFAVDEKFRNKKIGKQLMHHCLNTFTTNVTLHVRVTNDIAINLYKSLGFIEKETLIEYYANPKADAFTMTRAPMDCKYDTIKNIKC